MTTRKGISCLDVTKSFGHGRGLSGVTFSVPPSCIYALVGANGAGKTTLIHILLGFLAPDSGSVGVNGIDVTRDPCAAKRQLAYVPEVARLYPHLNALQNMAFFDGLMGRQSAARVYIDALGQFDFPSDAVSDPVSTYSKGMRQKLAIAIGLLKGADVFLLDEPTSGLDPQSNREFCRVVRSLRSAGKSVLFATHDVAAVAESADVVALLDHGRLIRETDARAFVEADRDAILDNRR